MIYHFNTNVVILYRAKSAFAVVRAMNKGNRAIYRFANIVNELIINNIVTAKSNGNKGNAYKGKGHPPLYVRGCLFATMPLEIAIPS